MTATFIAQSGVEDGMAVKLAGDSTVGPCPAGERFCGVARAPVRLTQPGATPVPLYLTRAKHPTGTAAKPPTG
ncbi:hypothetical protein NE626_16250, partial [Intestinimonas massiliensis]|nr:hypothetical protein [Intestinimonas massiliensis (ex Afouda et al. 2020)]